MENKYAPPVSRIADATTANTTGVSAGVSLAPQSVRIATSLLWLSVAIGVVKTISLVAARPRTSDVLAVLVVILGITFGLYIGLIQAIRQGRNWARILTLILVSGGFIVTALSPGRYFPKEPGGVAVWVAQGILQATVLSLLFSKSARGWFRRS